ncbi:MAG: 2,3-bisphosphoglycerate-independent phosphoglycerate mutase [Deltaproteobacteria bacterium]|nr:2,3-bisphosphoglycerate-independent phosphoglycerate mutase [Deltaproteobacteria bacterium]
MNILLLILDGLADRPQQVLGGKTPLEAAHTPHLDRLAELGTNGLLVPLAPGIPLESEFSHFLLFGYPQGRFPGRAAFEAIGRGFAVPEDSVVFLASFATVSVLDGQVRRETILWEERRLQDEDDCEELTQDLAVYESRGIRFVLRSCGRCEAILTLTGNPSRFVSDVDPFYNGAWVAHALPLEEDADQENAERTADALHNYLTWAYRRLVAHPVNQRRRRDGLPSIDFLLTKWAAVPPEVPPFIEQNGLRAASVENYPLYIGIARVCGMTPVSVPPHASIEDDLREKLATAHSLFAQGYEFVHVHSKGPDIAGHRKDPLGKKAAIVAIDRALETLVARIEQKDDLVVVVTGDHATPSSGPLIHSGEAVPLLIAGGGNILVDNVTTFGERAAVHGGLGRVYGTDLMPLLLNLTDRVRLHGVRHQRQARPYWPRSPQPFTVK